VNRRNPLLNGLLVAAGSLCVGLGILGILLPVLPTTPFLLLAAACYVRSSRRLYDWLLAHKWTGQYIRNYCEGRGMPLRAKVFSIALLWITLAWSASFTPNKIAHIFLSLVAVGVPVLILSVPTLRENEQGAKHG
jgi:uncharacterized membrane protein YbaN (DUF454 family)